MTRRAGRTLARTAVLVLGWGAVAGGLYLLSGHVWLELFGVRVEAEVVEVRAIPNRSTSTSRYAPYTYFATLRFETPDGRTVTTEGQVSEFFHSDSPPTAQVIYDPDSPDHNVVGDALGRWVVPGFVLTFGLFLLGFAPIIWPKADTELQAAANAASVVLHPAGPRGERRKPIRGRFLTGVMVALMWNGLLAVLYAAMWEERAYVPMLVASPLALVGVVMLVGLPLGFVQHMRPFYELRADAEPRPGSTVTLYWMAHGFEWLLRGLTIRLVRGSNRDPEGPAVVDGAGPRDAALGRVELTIPSESDRPDRHLLVEGRRLLGPDIVQRHPLPGPTEPS